MRRGEAEGREPATTRTMFAGVRPRAFMVIAGDSRYHRLRSGRPERFTVDQTMAEVMVETGALTREKAESSRLKPVLWSAVGNTEIRPEVRALDIVRSDRHLLCTDGLTKLILDPESERILGVGLVGPGAGELIAEGVLAIELGANATDLKLSIHPHPTLTETMMESAEVFFGQATHVYKPKKK